MATAKEHADRLGITTLELFRIGYARHGRLYSIGGPAETHARYEQAGVVPIYVQRYLNEMERLANYDRDKDTQLPLFI